MLKTETTYGIFKEEIKNRFLCMVCVNGFDTICYISSSCRLSNFLDLTNREVILRPVKNSQARTHYSVYAVKYRRAFVPVNLSDANEIVVCGLQRKMFSFLGERSKTQRERVIDGYKSDVYIENSDTIIEIKSILNFEQTAYFPTVYSERAIDQLVRIKDLLDHGHRVCYMFISMYSGVKKICLNREQEDYYQLFKECIIKGMIVSGFSLGMNAEKAFIKARIKVDF